MINISRNAVKKIEPNSFENCANITLLDLSHNFIEDFPKETFDSTTYANELQLSYNFLTDLAQVEKEIDFYERTISNNDKHSRYHCTI